MTSIKAQDRFSPYHLESNECVTMRVEAYLNFKDQVSEVPSREKGILSINSKSLIFETLNSNFPLFKILFHSIEDIKSRVVKDDEIMDITTSKVTEIKTSGPVSPHTFFHISKPALKIYTLQVAKSANVYSWIIRLIEVARIDYQLEDPLLHVTNMMLKSIEKRELDSAFFESINEKLLVKESLLVNRIQPMYNSYGLLTLTDRNFYFREIMLNQLKKPLRIPLSKVKKVLNRRYQLKYRALELETDDASFYFNFNDTLDRDLFHQQILTKVEPNCFTESSIVKLTDQWVNRQLSNFEYLLSINYIGQRSFNDLSQYPVFPWTIVDFESEEIDVNNEKVYRDLSKPIGALNEKRLNGYKERMQHLPDSEKFLYGTHYSSPGYVAGYLVRSKPQLTIRLQSGKFDVPDRLFYSVKKDWFNCYSHDGCNKELIPEFYMDDDSFLINKLNLNLGVKQNKKEVNHVVLPPWAKDSAQTFLRIMREALESEYVSAHLNQWIDLIFGYKQSGENAIKYDNLYHPKSYEGNINLDAISEPFQRRAIKDQINEFGQTPKQVFFAAHPSRKTKQAIQKELDFLKNTQLLHTSSVKDSNRASELEQGPVKYKFHKKFALKEIKGITVLKCLKTANELLVVDDNMLRIFNIETEAEVKSFSLNSEGALCVSQVSKSILVFGNNDGSMTVFNTHLGLTTQRFHAHINKFTSLYYLSSFVT